MLLGAVFVLQASLRPVYTYKFAFSGFFHRGGGGGCCDLHKK